MWNLLVVEDESIVRVGLRYMMNWEDCGICWKAEAANGEEALQIMEKEDIHIVMTDIRMPGLDGLELAKRIKARSPGVQIIMLSSYDTFAYVKEALRLGAADYLHKPTMDEEEIACALRKVVGRLELTGETKPNLTQGERNDYFLSLLDKYTYPEQSAHHDLSEIFGSSGCWLTVFRKRDDAVQGNENAENLRFVSIQYLIEEVVAKEWGGVVFHRSLREIIWIAPSETKSGPLEKNKYLENLRHKVLELLSVALIYSASSCYPEMSRLPDAYMEALLRFPVNEQSDSLIVRRAKRFIDDHLLEDITLVKVASAIHASPGYLSRVFMKEIGENFIEYTTRNKLEYAQQLLRETSRKVYEIAADLGYTNPHYFSKLFKDRVGISPVEYRNQ